MNVTARGNKFFFTILINHYMKKIFTLIAVAAAALSVNAQTEKLVFAQDATCSDNQVFTTEHTTLTLGNDQTKGDGSWTVKVAKASDFMGDLIQQGSYVNGDGDTVEGDIYVNIVGGQNPKDKTGKSSGSGFNAAEGKTTGNLPQSGTYYIIETKTAGVLKAGIILNADKEFYVVDATNAVADETETYLQVALPEAQVTDYQLIGADGVLAEDAYSLGDKNGLVLAEKLTGFVQFNTEANHKYYIFCTGSKLGFYGYTFSVDATGISSVQSVAQTGDAVYNLAGQRVQMAGKGLYIVRPADGRMHGKNAKKVMK